MTPGERRGLHAITTPFTAGSDTSMDAPGDEPGIL
jgi:hypothetical protein